MTDTPVAKTYMDFHVNAVKHPLELVRAVLGAPDRHLPDASKFVPVYHVHALGTASFITTYHAKWDAANPVDPNDRFILVSVEVALGGKPSMLFRLYPVADYGTTNTRAKTFYSCDTSMPTPQHNHHMLFLKEEDAQAYLTWCKTDPTEIEEAERHFDECDSFDRMSDNYFDMEEIFGDQDDT